MPDSDSDAKPERIKQKNRMSSCFGVVLKIMGVVAGLVGTGCSVGLGASSAIGLLSGIPFILIGAFLYWGGNYLSKLDAEEEMKKNAELVGEFMNQVQEDTDN